MLRRERARISVPGGVPLRPPDFRRTDPQQAGRKVLKREGAGHSPANRTGSKARMCSRDSARSRAASPVGVTPTDVAKVLAALVEGLLVQGAVERGEAGYVRREARRRRFEVAAHAGDDIKGYVVSPKKLLQVEDAAFKIVLDGRAC